MTYKKKLIEVALPLAAINEHSAKQKSMGAAAHPQNLHRWWARRPAAATRAVLWASLVDDPSAHPDRFPTEESRRAERKRLLEILERLVPWEAGTDQRVLAEAREEIERSCGSDLPMVLDPFGGGGAIPMEAARLGLPACSGDLNPIAVLIQRAMLEIPGRFLGLPPVSPSAHAQGVWEGSRGIAADVEAYGTWIRDAAHGAIGRHFCSGPLPDGSPVTPVAWIWARTVQSPDPSWRGQVPLVRSWVLSKKAGRPIVWVEPVLDDLNKRFTYEVREGGDPPVGTVKSGKAVCLATGVPILLSYVDAEAECGRLGQQLMAVIGETASASRLYLDPRTVDEDALNGVPSIDELESRTTLPREKTRGTFASNAQGRYYGMKEFKDYFTPRQLLAITTFSDLLGDVRQLVLRDALAAGRAPDGQRLRDGGTGAEAYADAIITYLAFVVDKCVDNWSSLCTWNAPNAQLRYTFAEEQLAMSWDFVEANPFSGRGGGWDAMLGNLVKAIPTLVAGDKVSIAQRDAKARVLEAGESMLCTDPPYYHNVTYADLSDFFYVWLRRNLRDVWPDEFATLLTPKADELIADQYRAGSKKAAQSHFENGMRKVFEASVRTSSTEFPSTIFYAFKATEVSSDGIVSTGWETFLTGLISAGYVITATWPMRTERGSRTNSIGASALASSIVLACRPRRDGAPMATRAEFLSALRSEMEPAIRLLQVENIPPVDMAQSAMGPGVSVFSRYAKVVEADGSPMTVRTALALINEVLGEVLSGEESEFDSDTRFAITWFEQYGHNPGPYGDAATLARAKNTSVEGVERAGVLSSRDGKVRLVERAELATAWDPATDARLTVWETTQYLIRAVESSEYEAAALLTRMGGGVGERARQLAYLLYGLCDRKRWAEEAGAYNMLVTAWPEISRLAAAGPAPEPDGSLF